jgi:hypothetical protein
MQFQPDLNVHAYRPDMRHPSTEPNRSNQVATASLQNSRHTLPSAPSSSKMMPTLESRQVDASSIQPQPSSQPQSDRESARSTDSDRESADSPASDLDNAWNSAVSTDIEHLQHDLRHRYRATSTSVTQS